MGSYVSSYFTGLPGTEDTRTSEGVVIGFIDSCSTCLDIAIYSLTHDDIAAAILRAHQRGVPVRLLTDSTQAGVRGADWEMLQQAGVSVRRDIKSGSMHHKFAIGDGRVEGHRAVLTGSFNFTKNAAERNAENFVIIRLQYTAAEFQAMFDQFWDMNAPV
jgi:phosphatidylserine/phosphatidylglycerophosphate/cardiolipin synthase-like enzyme